MLSWQRMAYLPCSAHAASSQVPHPVDFNWHCQLKFGECAQVDEEHDNSIALHMTGAIVQCDDWVMPQQIQLDQTAHATRCH
jgi:hypothetical protein